MKSMNVKTNNRKFIDLTSAIYVALDIDVPAEEFDEDSPHMMNLEFDDTQFTLAYCAQLDLDKFSILCRFGQIPPERESEVLRRILEVNLMLGRARDITLGADPVTRDIVLLFSPPLGVSTADSTLNAMGMMADQAQAWRRTFFLDDDYDAGEAIDAIFRDLV